MRRVGLALLLALSACPGGDTRVFTAAYELSGHLRGARALDDREGGRVTCAVDADPDDPLDPAPVLTVAAVSATDGRRQPGVYFTVRGFRGADAYTLGSGMDRGAVVLFDEATLADCARAGDSQCYRADSDCFLLMESWVLSDPVPPGVRTGTATGHFACDRLENAVSEERVKIVDGTFSCRATDWTGAR